MARGYTFLDLAKETLDTLKRPLSPTEIWQAAVDLGLDKKVGSKGKTPWDSISAQLYTSINGDSNSPFKQVSRRPSRFALATFSGAESDVAATQPEPKRTHARWLERDLHPLLATYVKSAEHFRCVTRAISEKKSKKGGYANADRWTHPDVVGAYFPYDDYDRKTIDLIEALRENPYTIFSFELKREVHPSELREKYFQAVSNSSWANEGYLVAAEISRDADFLDDLQRLVNAFGIGVIELNIENIEQSEVLYPARRNPTLDWATVDRIASMNPDFRSFIDDVVASARVGRVVGDFDKTIRPEDYAGYLQKHNFTDGG